MGVDLKATALFVCGAGGLSIAEARRRREILMGIVDKAKDKAQVAKGEVKEKAGKATKDRSLQAKGNGNKASGNLKQAGEKVKDAL
jgi:uncharacterized protein YjbJ (UPF0337 family)